MVDLPGTDAATILIVDDDPVFGSLLRDQIRAPAYDVRIAHSVEDASIALASAHFDVVITDVNFGSSARRGGFALVDSLRGRHPRTSVVVYSEFTTEPDYERLAGRDVAVFSKSDSVDVLRRFLDDTILARGRRQTVAASVAARIHSIKERPLDRIVGPDLNEVDASVLQLPVDYQHRLATVERLPLRLLRAVMSDPRHVHRITPRQFEEFTAEILEALNFRDIVLTPQSGDGGRDVIASKVVNDIPLTFFFECKHYNPDNKVQLDTLRCLLGVVAHHASDVNIGVLVTTSTFTAGARDLILSEARLDGKDYDGILGWVDEARQMSDSSISRRGLT